MVIFSRDGEAVLYEFPYLVALRDKNKALLGLTYNSNNAAREIICHIAGLYEDELKHHFPECNYFSVHSDGSTDRTLSEKEIVCGIHQRFPADCKKCNIF